MAGRKLKFLSAEQKKFYDDNGYVKLSGLFTEREWKETKAAYEEVFERKKRGKSWCNEEAMYNDVEYNMQSIHNLQLHSYAFTRLLTHEKLLDAIEDVLETSDLLLHHTKAQCEPPCRNAPYLVHQECPYLPFKNHTMLAAFVHVDDVTPECDGLCVFPGSHKVGPIPDVNKRAGDGYLYVDPERSPGHHRALPITAKQGDVVLFSYLLLHGSRASLTASLRRMFLLEYRAAEDEPASDTRHSHCQNLVVRGTNRDVRVSAESRYIDAKFN